MSSENQKSQRITRFPGKEEYHRRLPQIAKDVDKDLNGNRKTHFPGSLDHDFALLTSKSLEDPLLERRTKDLLSPVPLYIPLTIRGPDAAPSRPLKTITKNAKLISPTFREENPWATYKPLRNVVRRNKIQVAYTRDTSLPTVMVALKEASTALLLNDIIQFQHQNLVLFLEIYKYESKIIVASEYMQVSLRQTLAISYDFEEIHISAVCTQVFDGMQYLSMHGYSHKNLDSSKVLLSSNGSVKITYIGDCQETGFTSARPLGLLAIEIIQKGVIQDGIRRGGKIIPQFPKLWSSEAMNFLEITSFCSLDDIKTNHFLKRLSPTIMSPFVSYTQLEAIAPQIRNKP